MDTLEMLGVALGLATLAGLNLYLTVFATGLCIHMNWVALPANLQPLEVLADPWVIGVSALLYVLEFFADKIPWVDSLNDSVHTVIRPVGGAVLAILALGDADPTIKVLAALIAGGAALTSHFAKAGTRLMVNASPEPVSNIGLSLGEDAVVLGGLSLLAFQPLLAAGLCIAFVLGVWLVLPGFIRGVRATTWLAWRKLNNPADVRKISPGKLPHSCLTALRRAHASQAPVELAAFCFSDSGPRIPKNLGGWLVKLEGESSSLFFVAPRLRGPLVIEIPTDAGAPAERKPRFLGELLTIPAPGGQYKFQFEKGHREIADRFSDALVSKPEPVEPAEVLAGPGEKSDLY